MNRPISGLIAMLFAASGCHRSGSSPPGPGMVRVPAGPFRMGCSALCSQAVGGSDQPVHEVELASFDIDRTEVTQRDYAACLAAKACTKPRGAFDPAKAGELPVTFVTWDQARAYCTWAHKRLPTEAEWEKAARGNTDLRRYPWGDQPPDCTRANFEPCGGTLKPVGSAPLGASPYGALDMAGNAEEWVSDFYASGYYAQSPRNDPRGPDADNGSGHVVRGGSFRYDWWHLGIPVRFWDPREPSEDLGFRCAAPVR